MYCAAHTQTAPGAILDPCPFQAPAIPSFPVDGTNHAKPFDHAEGGILAALKSKRGEKAIIVHDLQAELAATLHELLPHAKRAAKRGQPALLRLITRYAANRYLLAKP